VRFLLEVCQVEAEPKDRWGHTPLWDAQMFSRFPFLPTFSCKPSKPRKDIASILKKHTSLLRMSCPGIEEELVG